MSSLGPGEDFLLKAVAGIKNGIVSSWNASKFGTVAAGGALGTGVAFGGSYLLTSAATGYGAFKTPGWFAAMGFEPKQTLANGMRMQGYGVDLDFATGSSLPSFEASGLRAVDARHTKLGWEYTKDMYKTMRPNGMQMLGLAGTAYSAYSGYQQDGVSGMYDALVVDAAVQASLVKWGYGIGTHAKAGVLQPTYTKLAGHPLHLTSGSLIRGAGAAVGGVIGQQIGLATGIPMAGTIGATAGAYIGGAPLAAMRASPFLVGGTLLATAGAAVAYGGYSVIKAIGTAGYNRRQSLKGINTDGDMSSFMTQNANTMRERAVQAIQKSHWNARQALGNEASFMHSPKNYNSRYR
jgi:hypothetical protein